MYAFPTPHFTQVHWVICCGREYVVLYLIALNIFEITQLLVMCEPVFVIPNMPFLIVFYLLKYIQDHHMILTEKIE